MTSTSHLSEILLAVAAPSATLAAILALALLGKSLLSFTQTGPEIRDEVLKRFAAYSLYALLRLTLWSLLILFWLGLIGTLPLVAHCLVSHHSPGWAASTLYALIGIGAFTSLQFVHQLLTLPTSLMMSSHYRMSRFTGLWQALSITRLRWLRILLVTALTVAVTIQAIRLFDLERARDAWGLLTWASLLALPWLLASLPLPVSTPRARGRQDSPPNILLIGSDTLRADRVGASRQGVPLTPFLDALVRRSGWFTNCHTPIARTAPSLVTLMTGTWPQHHGVRSNFIGDHETDIGVPGLAELLRRRGYATAAISDWAGSDLGKFPLGFEHQDLPPDQWNLKYLIRQGPKDIRLFLSLFSHNRFGKHFLPEIFYLAGIPLTQHLAHRARRWISARARHDQPFFLNLFMGTTHPPFGSNYPYYSLFTDSDYCGESRFAMARLTDPFEIIRSQQAPREAFDLDQILGLYDGCVRSFDDQVRRLFHHLERCGLADNTLVAVYSDHGMDFFENDTWGQGNSVRSDVSNRIPLILHTPRQHTGITVPEVVSTIDLAPTLLDLAGFKVPAHMDGRSLAPTLEGNPLPERLVYAETGLWLAKPPGTPERHLSYPNILHLLDVADIHSGTLSIRDDYQRRILLARDRVLISERWRLYYQPLEDGEILELFDLQDPNGLGRDVGPQHPEVLRRLRAALEPWLRVDRDSPSPSSPSKT